VIFPAGAPSTPTSWARPTRLTRSGRAPAPGRGLATVSRAA